LRLIIESKKTSLFSLYFRVDRVDLVVAQLAPSTQSRVIRRTQSRDRKYQIRQTNRIQMQIKIDIHTVEDIFKQDFHVYITFYILRVSKWTAAGTHNRYSERDPVNAES
jgi:hypothetical protein